MSGVRARRVALQQPVELLVGVAQVGLQDDPGRRPVPNSGSASSLQHELGDQVARVHRLHVDVQVRADLAAVRSRPRSRCAASAMPSSGASARTRGVSAVTLTERFTRGSAPCGVGLEQRARGPARGGARERAQRLVAAARVAIGLGGGDGRLAEQVDGRGGAGAHSPRERAAPASAGASPTMKRLAIRCTASPATPPTARRVAGRGDARRATVDRRERPLHLAEERSEVGGHIARPRAGGGHVDKPEERGPQLPGRATSSSIPRSSSARLRLRPARAWPAAIRRPSSRTRGSRARPGRRRRGGAGGATVIIAPRRYGLASSVTIVSRPEFLRRLFNPADCTQSSSMAKNGSSSSSAPTRPRATGSC